MTGIILAAGLSSRMGKNKLLLPFGSKTILASSIENAISTIGHVIVVTGNDREQTESIAAAYNIDSIYCPDYRKGQLASMLKGIESIENDDFAIIPGDLPMIAGSDFRKAMELLSSYDAVRPEHKGTPGHPVMFRKENRESILECRLPLKEYLKSIRTGLFEGSIGTILDADTPEAYARLLAIYGDPAIGN